MTANNNYINFTQHWNPLSLTRVKEFRLSFTFHLLLQGEASMDLLQFCLHGQPTNVGLQVSAVHHADAEHYECDMLRLWADQAPPPSACSQGLVRRGWLLLLVLKYNLAQWLWGPVCTFWGNQGNTGCSVKLKLTSRPLQEDDLYAILLCREQIMSLHQPIYCYIRIYILA